MASVKFDFSGNVALVTGAASGMGLAVAQAFAAAGAKTVLSDINEAALKKAVDEIRAKDHEATGIVCDVCDDEQVKGLIEKTVATYGRLDAAFNNAGIITNAKYLTDISIEEYDHILAVNLRGVFSAMKHELQQMRKQGSGAIVNNSSLAGLVGCAQRAQYAASKHGMLGMTKSVAAEVAVEGIRVNAICPGTIETPMVERMDREKDLNLDIAKGLMPIGRLGRVEEIASAVLWLCCDDSTFVIGQALAIDGGFTIQ